MQKNSYTFDLADHEGLVRIKTLLEHWYDIMHLQNSDSEQSIGGGAGVHYVVKIDIKEIWM